MMEVTRWSENQPRFAGESFYFIPEERELRERPNLTRGPQAALEMRERQMAALEERRKGDPRAWGFHPSGKGLEWASGRLLSPAAKDPREFGFHPGGKGMEWRGDPREFGFHPGGKGMEWRDNMPF